MTGPYTGSDTTGAGVPAEQKAAIDYSVAKLAGVLRVNLDQGITLAPARRLVGPVDPDASRLWESIKAHSASLAFPEFERFVQRVLVADPGSNAPDIERALHADANAMLGRCFVPGTDLYELLKTAAEAFLLTRCGVCSRVDRIFSAGGTETDIFAPGDSVPAGIDLETLLRQFLGQDRSSYIHAIARSFPDGVSLVSPFSNGRVDFGPCLLELIWSYWHEEAMLVQTVNAISLRFQNVRRRDGLDPLAEFELDPLRPLSGFLWGYVRDEPNRLSVMRRAYEYNHHYGLSLFGRAVSELRPADPRLRFLESFHDLLRQAAVFYREAGDNTVTPDAFPLLVTIKAMHVILSEGAHNQFRDLPWTARAEMLVQQWMLARPETREFLRGRRMVPYTENWMGAVDAMKRLQRWTDVSVSHFSDLAIFGERILLSIRHVGWAAFTDPAIASDWALAFRAEIQGYIHAYRTVTGVNLSDDVVDVRRAGDARYLPPSVHLRQRQVEQQAAMQQVASGNGNGAIGAGAAPNGTRARALPSGVAREW